MPLITVFFPSTGNVAMFFAHILYNPFMRSSPGLNTANGVQTKRGIIFSWGARVFLSELLRLWWTRSDTTLTWLMQRCIVCRYFVGARDLGRHSWSVTPSVKPGTPDQTPFPRRRHSRHMDSQSEKMERISKVAYTGSIYLSGGFPVSREAAPRGGDWHPPSSVGHI